ncbi:MAG: hypothetical protein AAFV31_16060 [Pseudomonadota bacterium]
MKTLIAAATLALISAPAFAQVTDVEAHFASDFTANEARVYTDGVDGNVTDLALELHAALYEEDETNNRGLSVEADDIRISTRGVANEVAADIFAQIKAESRDDE